VIDTPTAPGGRPALASSAGTPACSTTPGIVPDWTPADQESRSHAALQYLRLHEMSEPEAGPGRLQRTGPPARSPKEHALKGNRRLRGRLGEAQILTEYGDLHRLRGDYRAAYANLTRAVELNRELGYPLGEPQALNAAGEFSLELDRLSDARAKHEKARTIAVAVQSRPEEARALEGIGRCHLRDGRRAEGAESLRQALAIYEEIGSSGAGRVRLTLDDHDV
jgi:tetratricopeptide (TPR) repeat protein